ncbi:RNA-binding protein Cwf29 [Cryomyces antarcticus]|uniref:RNA-binding protein Cwf29 n=1 Tax=Cryomyces antarcticus TaxID=329879 RepID=A0ABR0LQ20_9PEZI|nr:RNA-binding protein Cwf29 [Cryomyces antarcticus]KAK5201661.1 RNA-binding protein Cwf29 [Cryomyces antarcticus]
MNSIRQIQALNARELEAGVTPEASWHADYRDTAYIYIGGLPFELSEGDVIAIFSQFGEPVHVNLVRDKETGKSKGFAFLKYEDQRSTDLAVDNLGGATVMGRMLRVDHTRYKRKDGEEGGKEGGDGARARAGTAEVEAREESDEASEEERRPMLREEIDLAKLIREHDDDDPMKAYLVKQKQEETAGGTMTRRRATGITDQGETETKVQSRVRSGTMAVMHTVGGRDRGTKTCTQTQTLIAGEGDATLLAQSLGPEQRSIRTKSIGVHDGARPNTRPHPIAARGREAETDTAGDERLLVHDSRQPAIVKMVSTDLRLRPTDVRRWRRLHDVEHLRLLDLTRSGRLG